MAHSDDRGLVLPPKIAPKQVAIIPIKNDSKLLSIAEHIQDSFDEKGITSIIDYSDKSPGYKFVEAEVNGYPIRIEIGFKGLENNEVTIVRRDTLEKNDIKLNDVINVVGQTLDRMQDEMYQKALDIVTSNEKKEAKKTTKKQEK